MKIAGPIFLGQTEEVTPEKPLSLDGDNSARVDTVPLIGTNQSYVVTAGEEQGAKVLPRQAAENKTGLAPSLSLEDSLLLNLIGKNQAFTNWHLSLTPNFDKFSDTAFSRFDIELTAGRNKQTDTLAVRRAEIDSSLSVENDTSTATNLTFNIERGEILPEKGVTIKPPLREDWFLAVLTVSLLAVGLVRLNWRGYLNNILQSVIFKNSITKIKISAATNFFPSLILGGLFYFNTSIFIYQTLEVAGLRFLPVDSFLIIPALLGILIVLFSLKIIVYKITGYIFKTRAQVQEYLLGSYSMSQAYGILLLPVIIIIPFLDPPAQYMLVKIGAGLFILLYLIQIVRGIRIILTNTFSVYYIILYLCALEILPLAILIKVIFR